MRSGALAAVTGAAVLALAGCAGTSPRGATLPAVGASAAAVMDTYLLALVDGDCATTRALSKSTFDVGDGELCGEVKVSSFSLNGDPATPGPDEVVYSAVLTTEGSSDGSIARGETPWFYDLERRDGTWRIVGGGPGP